MNVDEEELKRKLTSEEYRILRQKGTEAPFSGKFVDHNEKGMYTCMACGAELFSSDTKFESTAPGLAGWPSFANPANNKAVKLVPDDSMGMHRTEVVCANCGSHLGHVFDDAEDAPQGGKHYCINSTCLAFNPKGETK